MIKPWALEIVGQIELGDRRLSERLAILIETLAERPADPIPQACKTWPATLAAYRFFDNDKVEPEKIIERMAQATVARCKGHTFTLAVQDTTSVNYTTCTETTGLGPLENPRQRGLFAHTTLAVSAESL